MSDIPAGKSLLDMFGAERMWAVIWTRKPINTSAQRVPANCRYV